MARLPRLPSVTGLLVALLFASLPAVAIDIVGVQNAAIDQPQVYGLLRAAPDGPPLAGTDILGDTSFAIRAFLDTGASGIVLSEETADLLGVPRYANPFPPPPALVQFGDVGIGGTAAFNVSQPLYLGLAPYTPSTDYTAEAAFTQSLGPVRTQIGPLGVPGLLGGTDVFGIPAMSGKVVVMDPKPTNTALVDPFNSQMRTFVYAPGTAFSPASPENPGIPPVNRTVDLSYGSFDRFTTVTPAGADAPTLAANPFVGPDPTATGAAAAADATPGVKLTFGGRQTTGSLLLDTGAVSSAISEQLAGELGVRYRVRGTAPVLEVFDPANPGAAGTPIAEQFVLTLGGIGGAETVAGFYLDSLLVRTMQGNASNDADPAHLRYLRAPVLVLDISLRDPDTGEILTLDGLFAMNLLVASVFFDPADPLGFFDGPLTPTAFNWIVFDHPAGALGLDVAAIPEPGTWALLAAGLLVLAAVARGRAQLA